MISTKRLTALVMFLLPLLPLVRQDSAPRHTASLPEEDRIRVAEAFRLADSVQDKLWPGWSKAPFGLMLITNEYEYLIRHPHATNNFDTLGFDPLLRTRVLFRKRLFPTNLLATFPAINDIPTIVVGQAANTGVSSSTAWILTILHEHFHQYQQSQPDYYASTQALGLSHGDETGMWMLNFPFPYDSIEVEQAYGAASRALLDGIRSSPEERQSSVQRFLGALERLRSAVSPDDYSYFSFECWQEGVARYTELSAAELAATQFTPDNMFHSLSDYRSFKEVAESLYARIVAGLANPSLATSQRVAFYAFGAGEALLLDKVDPEWKKEYFRTDFHLERLLSK
jgi:hypothetical protein